MIAAEKSNQKGIKLGMNLSNLRMFSEVRCSFGESYDNFGEVVDLAEMKYEIKKTNKDEFLIKPKDANAMEDWEIRIFRTKKFIFAMNSCINYDRFVEILETVLKKISGYLTPADIVAMGVEGLYLYPVSSLQEFSQLVFAWSDNYLSDETTQVEISDLGVDVAFQKDSLKINIICKLIQKAETDQYFPMADAKHIQDLNLFINIQVSTNEPLRLQKSITLSLSQTIKSHVYQATKLIEQRMDKLQAEGKL